MDYFHKDDGRTVPTACSLILAVLLISYYVFPIPQLISYYFIKDIVKENPQLEKLPHPLMDLSLSSNARTKIASYGYEFEIPWVDIAQHDESKYFSRVFLKSNIVVVFNNPSEKLDVVNVITNSLGPTRKELVLGMYGKDNLSSNYSWTKAVLASRPSDISIFESKNKIVQDSILIRMKLIESNENCTGDISIIDGKHLHGFQFGNPLFDSLIKILLFDEHDKQLEIWVTSKKNTKVEFKQSDINVIIQSLHPTSEPNTVLHK